MQGPLAGEAVGGEFVGGPSRKPSTFASGRICEEEGCTTQLSVYNSRTRCSVHDFDTSLMNFRCPTHAPLPQAAAGATADGKVGAAHGKRTPDAASAPGSTPGRRAA